MTKILSNKSNIDLDYPICRPSLDLDFTQEELDPRITFSRGSIGTRVNRNRLIETVSANLPRFDYDPVTGECKGLLIEETRTNLLTNSNTDVEFSNGARPNTWTSGQLAPDGSSTAKLCVTNNRSFKEYISASVNNVVSTFSIYLKTNGSIVTRTFDLRDISSDTVRTTKTITITPNWQRFDITGTVQSNGIRVEIIGGIFNIFAWGAQLEQGAFPTSYIPTIASTVTRSTDLARMTGTNFSSWYNPTEGTLYAAVRTNSLGGSGYPGIAYVDDGTLNNCIGLVIMDAVTDRVGAEAYASGANQFFYDSNSAIVPNQLSKVIASYSFNNYSAAFSDRNNIQRDIRGSIPTVNRLLLGDLRGGNGRLNGVLARFTYYPRKLKDNQLLYLTQ